jgi:hypothetical protein
MITRLYLAFYYFYDNINEYYLAQVKSTHEKFSQ